MKVVTAPRLVMMMMMRTNRGPGALVLMLLVERSGDLYAWEERRGTRRSDLIDIRVTGKDSTWSGFSWCGIRHSVRIFVIVRLQEPTWPMAKH
ncbi:unnamed protein product [Amoebophrya sp. A25]|nr:unnamed protein product [Amoebophrya sp. A25]|eukprot:GSA25T00015151001.1